MANSRFFALIGRTTVARWQRTLHAIARPCLTLALMLAVMANISSGQELDSAALQKEAAAAAQNSPDAKAQQQALVEQNQVEQNRVEQNQVEQNRVEQNQGAQGQTHQPQPQQPQTTQPQAAPAQNQPQGYQPQIAQPQMPYPANQAFMLPPGTKLPLGLLRPLRVKAGRDVYLQITFPVTVGSEMVIPPGTYIQGVLDKIIRRDRRRGIVEFSIRSASLIFLNGYTVPISGTVTVGTTNSALLAPQPGKGNSSGHPAAAMAAVGGPPPLPALPPDPFAKDIHTAMVVIGVVAAVAVTTAIVLAVHSDTYVEVGTPLEIILPAPLFLDATRVMGAVQQYNQQAGYTPVQIVQPPVKPKMCYDPGSPGTPDIVIPGSSGTPDTVIPGANGMPDTVIPGSPKTPDTVIHGSPGTLGSWYECAG